MAQSKHTPGPWRVLEWADDRKGFIAIVGPKETIPEHIADIFPFGKRAEGTALEQHKVNAHLIAAAPDLLSCQTMGAEANTPDFLDWIADRLIERYGESPNVDFVLSLRERAKAGRAAIAKCTGSE